MANLITLCTHHHRLHHHGAYTIEIRNGTPRFVDSHGRPIARGRPPPPTPLPPATATAEPPRRTGEALTNYGTDILVTHLLTAA